MGGGGQGNVISHFLPLSGFGEEKKKEFLGKKQIKYAFVSLIYFLILVFFM